MKIMLDTNILISALVFGGKAEALLIQLLTSDCEVYVSEYVAKELSEKVALKWPDKAERLLKVYHQLPFHFCKSTEHMRGKLRDKKDIPVLSDALYYHVDIILTGDKDFLEAQIEKPMIFSIAMMNDFLQKKGKIT